MELSVPRRRAHGIPGHDDHARPGWNAAGHGRRRPGEWRTLGLFAAADAGELERVLASMPLRIWRTDEVTR
nr:muconolactone Delta-isomerase family protein [Mycobacterium sp. 1081908.1]